MRAVHRDLLGRIGHDFVNNLRDLVFVGDQANSYDAAEVDKVRPLSVI